MKLNYKIVSISLFLLSLNTYSATNDTYLETRRIQESKTWMLNSYLNMAEKNPNQLLNMIEDDFKDENLASAKLNPDKAFAWQDRSAYLTALTQIYNPEASIVATRDELVKYKARARTLISKALLNDAALLVRDAAVESIRRINRMQPSQSSQWKALLEQAFIDRKNSMEGEGLFIRETILSALREASLKLDHAVKKSAELDQNMKVRELVKLWSTRAFDSL